jgi:hypothetical protein
MTELQRNRPFRRIKLKGEADSLVGVFVPEEAVNHLMSGKGTL